MSGHLKAKRLTGVRQEVKYLLEPSEGKRIKDALGTHIRPKIINDADHSWRISVYLDTPDFLMTQEGLKRGSQTTKLRVKRYYLLQRGKASHDDVCWVEVKTRAGSMVEKSRFQVTHDQVLPTIGMGPAPAIAETDEIAVRNFEGVRAGEELLPLFVSHYRRYTFQDKAAQMRITMDDHVSFHAPPMGVFTDTIPICSRAMLPPPIRVENRWIMEVKSLGLAPPWVEELLEGAPPCEYSKFVTGITALVDRGLLNVKKSG